MVQSAHKVCNAPNCSIDYEVYLQVIDSSKACQCFLFEILQFNICNQVVCMYVRGAFNI